MPYRKALITVAHRDQNLTVQERAGSEADAGAQMLDARRDHGPTLPKGTMFSGTSLPSNDETDDAGKTAGSEAARCKAAW